MVRIVEDIGTDRILINSACDWGVSDPLKVAKTVAAMQEAGLLRGRHRQGRLAQPARVLRPERPADPRRPARGPRPGGDVRGQHAAARGALTWRSAREAPPSRRQPPAPRVLLQRPPGRRPRRHRRPAGAVPRARARGARGRPARRGDVGRRARAARRGAPARAARRARPGGRDAQRLPLPRVPRRGRQARRLPPQLGDGRAARLHARASPGCSPSCCPTTSTRARSRRCRSAGARSGRARRPTAGRRALEEVADGLAELRDDTGKTIRLALEPEPGCTIETVAQAAAFLDGLAPGWIGLCLDACHLAVQFEDAETALAQLDAAGASVVKAQVSSALRVPAPGERRGPRVPGGVRRAALPAPDARVRRRRRARHGRPAGGARGRAARAGRVARALPRPRPRRRAHDAGRAARHAARAGGRARAAHPPL